MTAADRVGPDPTEGSEIFEFASHRRVWIDVRRGAAVMWTPSYYATWQTRVSEVLALTTLADKGVYAREHGIDYVVDACPSDTTGMAAAAFRADGLCVFPSSVGRGSETRP